MLHSISWNDFLTMLAVAVASYYVVTIVLFFGREIGRLFQPRTAASGDEAAVAGEVRTAGLMGTAKFEERESQERSRPVTTVAEELAIAPLVDVEEPIKVASVDSGLQTALVSSLLPEIESVLETAKSGNSRELGVLFKALLGHYPELVGTDFQGEITRHIYEGCISRGAVDVKIEDVRGWWPA